MTEDTTETGSTDDGDPTGEDTTPTDQGGVYTAEEWAEIEEEQAAANATYTCACGETFAGENALQRYAAHCKTCPVRASEREAEGEEATPAAQTDPAPAPETASGGSGGEESTPTPDSQVADDDGGGDGLSGPAILANDKWATRMFIGGWILAVLGTIYFNFFVHGGHPDGGLTLIIAAVLIAPLLFFFELETAAIRSLAVALRNRKK